MFATDPAAVVTRYIYAVRDGDSSTIRDSFAEDAVWEYPGDLPLSGTWRGRDTIVDDFLGSVGTTLEPGSTVALEVTSVLTAGDQVVAEWTSRATARGGAAYHNRNVGIFTVRDGEEAVEFLFCTGRFEDRSFEHPPRLVLLDLKLPKLTGLEVLKLVKNDPRTKAVPIVVLTASREERDLVASYNLGANSYIQKPVDFDQFREIVKSTGLYWIVINQHPLSNSLSRAATQR